MKENLWRIRLMLLVVLLIPGAVAVLLGVLAIVHSIWGNLPAIIPRPLLIVAAIAFVIVGLLSPIIGLIGLFSSYTAGGSHGDTAEEKSLKTCVFILSVLAIIAPVLWLKLLPYVWFGMAGASR